MRALWRWLLECFDRRATTSVDIHVAALREQLAYDQDRYYLDLKGARERLCRASGYAGTFGVPGDMEVLVKAISIIDFVGSDLPQWSRHDRIDR